MVDNVTLINPNMAATFPPPVMEARRWIDGVTFPKDRPLLNVSQAAPVDPPSEGLRQAMADAVMTNDAAHLYGPVLGLPDLRSEVAAQFSQSYGGKVTSNLVAITSGCNQAFAATLATLAAPGDEVVLPTPWYFNHKMWLDMGGISAVPLKTNERLIPSPEAAEALITSKTRAIVLVTPNNPGGVEYPADVVGQFFDLCRARGIALIIDETYRDFDSRTGAPHDLLTRENWDETLVQLYSFSKAYRLTGHRVGAVIASEIRLAEAEKFLDTVAICPAQVGQIAALWGLRNLGSWLGEQRAEILDRRAAIEEGFPVLEAKGWQLLGCGAYFAYVAHPFEIASHELSQKLVTEAGVLCLPGTMFKPKDDISGQCELRIAFANIDRKGIGEMFSRLAEVDL